MKNITPLLIIISIIALMNSHQANTLSTDANTLSHNANLEAKEANKIAKETNEFITQQIKISNSALEIQLCEHQLNKLKEYENRR